MTMQRRGRRLGFALARMTPAMGALLAFGCVAPAMRHRSHAAVMHAGLFGMALVAAAGAGCALRVGAATTSSSETSSDGGVEAEAAVTDGAIDFGATDAGRDARGALAGDASAVATSADGGFQCGPDGAETKLAFGGGTDAFAWAWDTDHYVVVFVDPTQGNGDIDVATLAADGTLRSGPVPIQATPATSDLPSLVKTESGFVVVWEEGSAGQSIYAHALGPDALPVGAGVSVGTTQLQLFQDQQARPVLSNAPSGKVAIAWMDLFGASPGVQLALVDRTTLASSAGPTRIAPADQVAWPWVAGDSSMLGLLWSDLSNAGDASVAAYGVRFAPVDTASLATPSTVALPPDGPHNAQLGRVIRTGSGFMAAWEDEQSDDGDNQIQMAVLDGSGNVVSSGLVEQPHSGDANWPNMVWTGTQTAVVYYQWRADFPQIFMTIVGADGTRATTSDLRVSGGTHGAARFPDVVWTGTELGVMYIDTRDGAPALWMQRVSCK